MSTLPWQAVGEVSPRDLVEARLVLHHAAQLVAAVGRGLVPPRPDDGHTSLEWRAEARGLAGQPVPGPRRWCALLRPGDLTLSVQAGGGEVSLSELTLPSRTRAEAFAWLIEVARDLGAPVERLSLDAPYAVPPHPVGAGAPFPAAADVPIAELARWLGNGDALLRNVALRWPGAAPVRAWPHHFDVGSVLPLGGGEGEEAPSIGIGLSLGDEGIPEPYLYVTPWPAPSAASRPDLPAGGHWHLEGWTGAVLTGSEIVARGGPEVQAAGAGDFLSGTVARLRSLGP